MGQGSVHRLTGCAHRLTGSAHRLTGCAHRLTGSAHRITGCAHCLTGYIHCLTGSAHCLTGCVHPLSGCAHCLTGCAWGRFSSSVSLSVSSSDICSWKSLNQDFSPLFWQLSFLRAHRVTFVYLESLLVTRNQSSYQICFPSLLTYVFLHVSHVAIWTSQMPPFLPPVLSA